MAKSGFIAEKIGTESLVTEAWGRVTWEVESSSPLTNTSKIKVNVQLMLHGMELNVMPGLFYRKIRIAVGEEILDDVTYAECPGANLYWTLGSYTFTISHNFDGSKTVPIAVQIGDTAYFPINYEYAKQYDINKTTYSTLSTRAELDPLDRLPKLLTAPNFTDEENPTITYSNPLGADMPVLEACIANSTGTVIYVPYRSIDKNGDSYTFNFSIVERNALRAAATGSTLPVRFYIKYTLEGQTSYLFLSRTMTLEDITPDLNPIVRDTDATIVALTGDNQKVVLGYSDIYYAIGVTPPEGAVIVSQTILCGGESSTTNNGTFIDANSNTIEFSARDSRGNVAQKTLKLETVPYIKVTCNQTVQLMLDGTISLIVKGNYFSDSFGAEDNSLSVQNRWRESGGEWSEWNSLDPLISDISNNTYTLTATISGFDPSGTYEFQSRAVDKLNSAESAQDSVVLKPIFDWGKNDFNFNVPVTIDGTLTIQGSTLTDYVVEYGTEAMGTNGTWYWEKWKSGKARCYGCRNFGNTQVATAWGNLYRSEYFTQDYPSGLFVNTPESTSISMRQGTYGSWVSRYEYYAPNKDNTGSFILVRPATAIIGSAHISFDVVGRWK